MENDLIRRSDVLNKVVRFPNYSENGESVDSYVVFDDDVMSIPAVDAVEVSGTTRQAVKLIVEERRRQIAEWGDQSSIDLFEFMSILGEEFGELCQAVNETLFVNPKHPERGGEVEIIREAVQVAAVAVQIIEAVLAAGQCREDGDI